MNNFESTLDKIHENNSFMNVVLDDFNAKSNNWCKSDVTSLEGSKIDTITSGYGLKKRIQEPPTHILTLVMESGIHSSLHSNCHH